MNANVGGLDRVIRLLAGVALIAAGFLAGIAEPWNYVVMGAGAVFALTGVIKFCPLYVILGANTCSKD